jgi:amidase
MGKTSQKMTWEDIVADKRTRLEATIPQEWRLKELPSQDNVMDIPRTCGILTDEEIAITESSATDLVEKLAKKQLTSVAVTTAFCKRAALAHQLVCNSSRLFAIDYALTRTAQLQPRVLPRYGFGKGQGT